MCGHNARLAIGLMIGACALCPAEAEITAKVNTDRVNARGRASIFSEVVAQLRQGDELTVLETIRHNNPRAGEPAEWVKIRMPKHALVWVNAVHVDTARKVVTATRLNVRAGPGQNYSIVGSLNQGAPVHPLRKLDDWIQIEAPSNSWAFVNSLFVTLRRTPPENAAHRPESASAPSTPEFGASNTVQASDRPPSNTNGPPVGAGTTPSSAPVTGQEGKKPPKSNQKVP